MNLQTINASASPEVQVNENFEVLDWATVYAKNPATSSGLTWGYYGGRWAGILIAADVLTLTNTNTNYIVVNRTTGVISTSTATTNWDDTVAYARVYKVVTAGGVVSGTPEDHRAGEFGIISGAPGGTHVDNETPAGTIDGTDGTDGNAAFTLAFAPAPAGSLQLFKTDVGTGVLMIAGVHYNLATLTITYTAGNLPITGQTHRAWYRK